MSEARAGAFKIAPGVAGGEVREPVPWAVADAVFGEGQISGPYGPKFDRFGRQGFHWRNWRGTAGLAAGIAALAFALRAAGL